MIITVTLNPAIDKYGETDDLKHDEIMRLSEITYEAGGKGINVSRVLKRFGIPNTALYFSGGQMGKLLSQFIEEEQIDNDFVPVIGNTRMNYTVNLRKQKSILKFNDPGPVLDTEELEKMLNLIRSYAKKDATFVFSGVVPPNSPTDIYAYFINAIKNDVKNILLDTEGDILSDTLALCSPDFIKPNQKETENLTGMSLKTNDDYAEALAKLGERVPFPVISAGAKGIYIRNTGDGKYYNVAAPHVDAVSTVGAGDAFVAGFILSLVEEEKPILEAAKMGVACGTASVLTPGTGLCYPKDVIDILDQVKVREI
jgi:1-phosphofructokinase family hexose kinase